MKLHGTFLKEKFLNNTCDNKASLPKRTTTLYHQREVMFRHKGEKLKKASADISHSCLQSQKKKAI